MLPFTVFVNRVALKKHIHENGRMRFLLSLLRVLCKIYDTNNSLFVYQLCAAIHGLRNGIKQVVVTRAGITRRTPKKCEAWAFMNDYFSVNCDKMPSCDGKMTMWHLPPTMVKADVWRLYWQFFERQGYGQRDVLTRCAFIMLWKTAFPHVTIPKRARFKQCTTYVSTYSGVVVFYDFRKCLFPLIELFPCA